MQLRHSFRERWRQQFAGFSNRLECAVLLWYRWKADEIHQTCQETNHRRDTVWRHHGRDETRRLWSHIAKLCCVHLEHEQIVPFVTTSLSNGIHLGPAYALTLVLSLTILHTLMFNSNSKSEEKEKRHQQKAFFPFCWRELHLVNERKTTVEKTTTTSDTELLCGLAIMNSVYEHSLRMRTTATTTGIKY